MHARFYFWKTCVLESQRDPNTATARHTQLRLVPKNFTQYPSHRIFRHTHGALNVVKKITNSLTD